MKILQKINALTASLLLAATFVSTPSVAATDASSNNPGTACHPANLGQALRGLKWDQFRVSNPTDESFFVACPVTRALAGADANDDNLLEQVFGWVDVWFDTGATEDVACIWREMPFDAAIASDQIFAMGTASLPSKFPFVVDVSFDLGSFSTQAQAANYQTVVCALPPKTGVNNIELYGSDVPAVF